MISSLYTFIALPKEVIWESIPAEMTINELNEKWGFKNGWKISKGEISNLKFRYLVRRLRNGINHGRINCNEELTFTIIDINPKDENDRIDFEIKKDSLINLIRVLGAWIMDDIELKRS